MIDAYVSEVDPRHPLERRIEKARAAWQEAKAAFETAMAAKEAKEQEYHDAGRPTMNATKHRFTTYRHVPDDLQAVRTVAKHANKRMLNAKQDLDVLIVAQAETPHTRNVRQQIAQANGVSPYNVPSFEHEAQHITGQWMRVIQAALKTIDAAPQEAHDYHCWLESIDIESGSTDELVAALCRAQHDLQIAFAVANSLNSRFIERWEQSSDWQLHADARLARRGEVTG